ncbi:hypothetical protein CKO09_08890 [Chromatium weissei]|nr:hypothetical protein [Chromatium weissei]
MKYLSRMLYVSRSSIGLDDDAELQKILEVSRRKNPDLDITGILCAGGGHFIQILEGPQENLIRLYGIILADPRHYDSVLVGIAPIEKRIFRHWSMGYLIHSPETMEANRKELLNIWQGRSEARELVNMMKRFLEQLDR